MYIIPIVILSYFVGFLVSLFLLHTFADSNYDEPKTYVNMDDWNSNAEAYLAWSFIWPMSAFLMLLYYSWVLGLNLSIKIGKIVKINNKK
jgi:hypothetical protein